MSEVIRKSSMGKIKIVIISMTYRVTCNPPVAFMYLNTPLIVVGLQTFKMFFRLYSILLTECILWNLKKDRKMRITTVLNNFKFVNSNK